MAWIEVHVFESGSPLLVNTDNICRVGQLSNTIKGMDEKKRAFIKQVDGSSVEVQEDYLTVVRKMAQAEKDQA